MKKFSHFYNIFLIIGFFTILAYGDYLEVSRSAYIYSDPDRSTTVLEIVSDGDNLKLLDNGIQKNGYYHVRTSDGQPGWIYRTLVRRYRGEIPVAVADAGITNPLADTTMHLTSEKRGYAIRHLRLGKPQAVYERVREGYVLAQDARLKIPLWVQYELSPGELQGPADRSDDFRPDTSIPSGSRAELSDYRESGFDRGHMAPAADMKRNQEAMSESFLLSNMAPQVGAGFNRNIWADLEASVRGWVEQRGTLTVIVGPIFAVEGNHTNYEVIGENQVAVPTHFYKIIVDANNPERIEALAFVMPNESLSGRQYRDFLASIDEIEAKTGLDFLSALPTTVQVEVESRRPTEVW